MFDPTIFGFTPVQNRFGSVKKDYCYCMLSERGGSGGRQVTARLVLDDETTEVCKDMFGDRVAVAINERG